MQRRVIPKWKVTTPAPIPEEHMAKALFWLFLLRRNPTWKLNGDGRLINADFKFIHPDGSLVVPEDQQTKEVIHNESLFQPSRLDQP